MTQAEVLQALSDLSVDGVAPLRDGFVQDVAIEMHGDVAFVGVHVDNLWHGAAPPEPVLSAMRDRVMAMPGVGAAKIIPRTAERRAQADAIARRRRVQSRPPALPGVPAIAVASGKGGVGKSTVAVNLAAALARRGKRTGLLDCDIYGRSAAELMGVEKVPRMKGDTLVPARAAGVEVMSMAFFAGPGDAVAWRGPLLGKALLQMAGASWSQPEIMVLDLPPGTGDMALDVASSFPDAGMLVVTTPDPAAARVAVRAGRRPGGGETPALGVVETMSYAACDCGRHLPLWGSGGGDLAARALAVPVLARIPWTEGLVGAATAIAPAGSAGSALFDDLADAVLSRLAQRPAFGPTDESKVGG